MVLAPLLTDPDVYRCAVGWTHHTAAGPDLLGEVTRMPKESASDHVVDGAVTEHSKTPDGVRRHAIRHTGRCCLVVS